MCKKASDWFREQFFGFKLGHWLLGAVMTGIQTAILGAIPMFSAFRLALLAILSFAAILIMMSLWRNRGHGMAEFFLMALQSVPDELENENSWASWLLKMEASLRARGLKRQSDILSKLVNSAHLPDRPEIAKTFLRQLAQTAKDTPKILGL